MRNWIVILYISATKINYRKGLNATPDNYYDNHINQSFQHSAKCLKNALRRGKGTVPSNKTSHC